MFITIIIIITVIIIITIIINTFLIPTRKNNSLLVCATLFSFPQPPSLAKQKASIRIRYCSPVPNRYPNPTRYPVFFWKPDLTQFCFENHQVAGNPKYRVLPDISGKPEVLGLTQYFACTQT